LRDFPILAAFSSQAVSWTKFLLFGRSPGLGSLARSVDSMAKGTVKWFNEKKGFGFIVDPEVPTDIFVHFSVIQADGFKTLNEGENVEYELYQDEKGAKARNVVRV
jgi:cold shock protein